MPFFAKVLFCKKNTVCFYVSSTLCPRSTFVLRRAPVQEHEGCGNGRQQSDSTDRYTLRGLFAFQFPTCSLFVDLHSVVS